jgi:DNA-binding transcriptional LysR family regulator
MNEADVVQALLGNSEVSFGLAAPYESSPQLDYSELFAMNWSLISPPGHPLGKRPRVRLKHIVEHPLILYERGSTGRQHVLDAFHENGLAPRVALETTSTETIVSMVESGLGVSVVPLMPNGAVTRSRRVQIAAIGDPIRPIHSGILVRRGEKSLGPTARLLEFTKLLFR